MGPPPFDRNWKATPAVAIAVPIISSSSRSIGSSSSWGYLGQSWAVLRVSWDPSEDHLGPPQGHLEPSWGHPGVKSVLETSVDIPVSIDSPVAFFEGWLLGPKWGLFRHEFEHANI